MTPSIEKKEKVFFFGFFLVVLVMLQRHHVTVIFGDSLYRYPVLQSSGLASLGYWALEIPS